MEPSFGYFDYFGFSQRFSLFFRLVGNHVLGSEGRDGSTNKEIAYKTIHAKRSLICAGILLEYCYCTLVLVGGCTKFIQNLENIDLRRRASLYIVQSI